MKYKDLRYKHINLESMSDVIYVTFSAWNPYGKPDFFGESFFLRRNIEAVLIAQNGVNHWWHTTEMEKLAGFIKERAKKYNKKIILYGSSMGGYGVCHYRYLFNSELAIAMAPQIFIDDRYHSEQHTNGGNKKALEEKILLQNRFKFDEAYNLKKQKDYKLLVFYDPMNKADSSHVKCYKKHLGDDGGVHFLNVPYANHDVARALNKAKFLEKIVLSSHNTSIEELENIVEKTYLYDHKACMGFLRHSSFPLSHDLYTIFEKYYKDYISMDFETLYMMAEVLMKLGRHEEAINISLRSIEVFSEKYSKPAPEYLRHKFKFIVKKALNSK